MMKHLFCPGLTLLMLVASVGAASSEESGTGQLETRVKAVYLYNFCRYVEWPAWAFDSPDAPIVVGVVGADNIARELEQATANRVINNHPLEVRRYKNIADVSGVHLLFVSNSVYSSDPAWPEGVVDKSVLLVTDASRGLDAGYSIAFVLEQDRQKFDISLAATMKRQLKVSSSLLSVARQVRGLEQ